MRYEIDSVLGEGGFARVYKARDLELGRIVALKVIAPKGGEYTEMSSKRFHREARVISTLQDPHTITLFDFGESTDGLLYMAFEFIDGEELKSLVKRKQGLAPAVVAHILMQLLSSLDEAHRNGILHRDLKPQNVLVFEYNGDPHTVKLLDFGIAKPTQSPEQNLTKTGALVGTPRYMSPEQVVGDKLTQESDIFSLGLLAIEMLSAEPAIQGRRVEELLAKASIGMFELPVELAPPGMTRVLQKMCAREPGRRYPSARAVMNALREVSDEVIGWTPPVRSAPPRSMSSSQNYAAHTPSGSQDYYPDARRRPSSVGASQSYTFDADSKLNLGRIALIGVAALAFIGVVLFVVDRLTREEEPPPPPTQRVGTLLKPAESRVAPATDDPADLDAGLASAASPDAGGSPDAGALACTKPAPFIGQGRLDTVVAFARSTHDVYIPRNYEVGVQHPMLVLFHDVQQTGSVLRRNQMDKLAEEMGMVVLMPSDPEFSVWWGDDDLVRTLEAIDAVQTELCVDPARIFAYGHGAGGRIAERLTCDYPQIAATATMSYRSKPGEPPPCRPNNPRPHLHIATLKNGYVPVNGGKGCGMTMAAALVDYRESLRSRWGCRGKPQQIVKRRDGTCWTWDCNAKLVSCDINGGREWPGTAPRAWDQLRCDGEPAKFPYRKVFRDFFESVK